MTARDLVAQDAVNNQAYAKFVEAQPTFYIRYLSLCVYIACNIVDEETDASFIYELAAKKANEHLVSNGYNRIK